jgi:hypothetical protein
MSTKQTDQLLDFSRAALRMKDVANALGILAGCIEDAAWKLCAAVMHFSCRWELCLYPLQAAPHAAS